MEQLVAMQEPQVAVENDVLEPEVVKKGRGRPKGSKNKAATRVKPVKQPRVRRSKFGSEEERKEVQRELKKGYNQKYQTKLRNKLKNLQELKEKIMII